MIQALVGAEKNANIIARDGVYMRVACGACLASLRDVADDKFPGRGTTNFNELLA